MEGAAVESNSLKSAFSFPLRRDSRERAQVALIVSRFSSSLIARYLRARHERRAQLLIVSLYGNAFIYRI